MVDLLAVVTEPELSLIQGKDEVMEGGSDE